ncbi:MAG: PilZ domain-containing protein [Burkholderiales bacterium]|nr:PilZ domain-containing protein [Burkholderiales bacterium]
MSDITTSASARPEDKRASPRRPLRCRVKVIGPKGTLNGESFDLSTGGIGVTLETQLALGDVCTVMFAPYRDGSVKSVTVSGKVAYCMLSTSGFRTGFQFQNVAASTTTILNSLVTSASSMPT